MDEELLPSEYYSKAAKDRKPYEDEAEALAKMTIPALMRDESWTGSSTQPDSYGQAFGARCVNNLSSKIGMTLFPPNASAFRLTPNADLMGNVTGGSGDATSEIQKDITNGQNKINDRLEAANTRNTIFTVLEHLIVVSSVVLEKIPKKGYKVHTLRNFVVSLDDKGEEYKLCVKEKLTKLPEGITVADEKEEYELYTQLEEVEEGKWVLKQEIDGEYVSDERTFTDENRPFAYQGWLWTQGDEYHRPYASSYKGGFEEYETWSKILTKGGLVSSKNITFVDERTGRTRLRDVRKADNGAIIQGRGDDVTSYQHGKAYDYQVAQAEKEEVKRDLSDAFLLVTRRQAERVTQEEIKGDTAELENALASMYSVVSNRLIKRMVKWAMQDLGLKLKTIQVDIVTGLDALGRAVEAQKLDELMTRAGQLGFADRFKKGSLAIKYAGFYNVPTDDILMSDEEYAKLQKQNQEALAQQQMNESGMAKAGQNMADAAIPTQG